VKRCTRCILPETFPGIEFDEGGVCQYCRRSSAPERRKAQITRLRIKFEQLVSEVRSRPSYHCLLAWSGGKDSTYTLWLLKEQYGLNVLAYTLDNGFVSPRAMNNMRVVAENLDIDHTIVDPSFDLLKQVFVASIQPGMYPPKALERASGICNSCMGIAKGIGLRIALEKEIPILAYGWSPGQIPLASAIFRFNPRLLRAMVGAAMEPLHAVVGDQILPYFPTDEHLDDPKVVPYNVSPLAFLDFDEEAVLHRIDALGWERPDDTDPNSTNCLLNSFANLIHVDQMGYHPYVMELAGLVREGYMEREEALGRLKIARESEIAATVSAKLGISI
jgi:hypothetical protein